MRRAVIGIGSPFGADRAGWQVVERLQRQSGELEADLFTLDRPGLSLLDRIKGYQQVVLVDAVLVDDAGNSPILHLDREDLMAQSSQNLSSHGSGVADAIALGEVLGDQPEQIDLIGVPITVPEGAVLSESIQRAAQKAVKLLAVQQL